MILKQKAIPLHKYLIEVEGLRKVYVDGTVKQFLQPSELYNRTNGLVTEGIVRELPLSEQKTKLLNKKVRFLYTDADATIDGKYPQIDGHLMVFPNNLTAFEGKNGMETLGDFISCSRIERNKTPAGLLLPGIKRISHDTARGEELEFDDFYSDKGIVNMPNEHFKVGTYVFFTHPKYAHKNWPEGMLIRRRNIIAWGPDVANMSWQPPIKIKSWI